MYKAGTECEANVEAEGIVLTPFSEITKQMLYRQPGGLRTKSLQFN